MMYPATDSEIAGNKQSVRSQAAYMQTSKMRVVLPEAALIIVRQLV